jgi:lysophospholipase
MLPMRCSYSVLRLIVTTTGVVLYLLTASVARAALTPLNAGVANRYNLITEDQYLRDYPAKVLPYVKKLERAGRFTGVDGVNIEYRTYLLDRSAERGAVVISSGRTESLLIYPEVIYDLARQGYSIYIHDHRGQGLSGRLLPHPQKSHVRRFDDYVADLKKFVDTVVVPRRHKKLFLVAHSMGGGIASLYIEQYPKDFGAAVLVTPMHEPLLPVRGKDVTTALCTAAGTRTAKVVLTQDDWAAGQGPYRRLPFGDKQNDLTHSKVRWEKTREIYAAEPTTPLGGPTHAWVREACAAAARARKDAVKASVPVLLLQATEDTAVKNEAQEEFCRGVNRGGRARCEGYAIEKAYHGVLFEADTFRIPAVTTLIDFLIRHSP